MVKLIFTVILFSALNVHAVDIKLECKADEDKMIHVTIADQKDDEGSDLTVTLTNRNEVEAKLFAKNVSHKLFRILDQSFIVQKSNIQESLVGVFPEAGLLNMGVIENTPSYRVVFSYSGTVYAAICGEQK